SIKNDGHYFCRAGGNRPDGLNEPVTDVKLKVLYKTSPLAGAIMELDSVSYLKSSRHTHAVEHKHPVHKAELTFVTNEDGIVTVPSLHIGQWLAKVQNKKSFQDKSLCDETVDVATLSFSRN
nr:hypothetical protein [Escherichia coli O25b:H4-ST131]